MVYTKSSTGSGRWIPVSNHDAIKVGNVWLTVTLYRTSFLQSALLLRPLFESGYVLGIHHPSSQDEACLFWRVLGLPFSYCLDHEHVLGRFDVLGVKVPLLQLRLVLLLAEPRFLSDSLEHQ